jgi:citrate lyase subunit gamma (acyl carrier protein)
MKIVKTSIAGTMESSEIMITISPASPEPGSGNVEIDLQSMVEKQFGRQIRQVIKDTLSELQISGVKVSAVDKGALDCTIRARVKTAVFRGADNAAYEWKAER